MGSESGKLLTLRQQLAAGFQPPVLVFVQSQERATELTEELLYDGRNVDVLHSGRTKKQRTDAAERFQRGECHILVATEVMSRGMDFAGVRLVINYDFPQSVQSYIHRIGGRNSHSMDLVTYSNTQVVLVVPDERGRLSHILRVLMHLISKCQFVVAYTIFSLMTQSCLTQDCQCLENLQ